MAQQLLCVCVYVCVHVCAYPKSTAAGIQSFTRTAEIQRQFMLATSFPVPTFHVQQQEAKGVQSAVLKCTCSVSSAALVTNRCLV